MEKEEGKNLEGEIPNFNVSSEKNNAGKFRDFVILEHLRNASADLRRKGRDPLPEAISLAKKVAEEEVKKSTTGEDQNKQTEVESEESGPKSVENEGEQKEENDNLVKPTPIRLQAAKSLLERQSNAQQLKVCSCYIFFKTLNLLCFMSLTQFLLTFFSGTQKLRLSQLIVKKRQVRKELKCPDWTKVLLPKKFVL